MERFAFLLGPDVHQSPPERGILSALKRLRCCVLNGELCWFCTLCCLFSLNSVRLIGQNQPIAVVTYWTLCCPCQLLLWMWAVSVSEMLQHNTDFCQHCEMLNSPRWHWSNQAWNYSSWGCALSSLCFSKAMIAGCPDNICWISKWIDVNPEGFVLIRFIHNKSTDVL